MKKIGVASDHAGYEMKEFLVGYLDSKGYDVHDYGCHSPERCDYPDFGHQLADAVARKEVDMGFALCGSGEGMAMTVNRHRGVRGALVWDPQIAELTRQHNNANICVLPARFISNELATAIVDKFLTTPFEGGRHEDRLQKIELK